MKTEYVVMLATIALGLAGWGIKAFWNFTKELTEWRVKLFDEENGLLILHQKLTLRVDNIERRLGWEGEFGRRWYDQPQATAALIAKAKKLADGEIHNEEPG